MATFKTGIQGALYIDGSLIDFVQELSVSIDRDTAEESIMGQEYKIARVGPYGGEFSGSALVDTETKVLLDEVLSVSTTTSVISIYPDRTDVTTGWYFDGQMQSWEASGAAGDMWAADFGGIIAGELQTLGFGA